MALTGRYQSRGLELVYHEWGQPDGPVLLLLHGFLDQGRSFRFLGAPLDERFRLIAPDHRGHGLSGSIGEGGTYYFPDYLLDLDALYDHLGLESAYVAGHSMGASMAVYLAGAHPERVQALVLLDGIGPPHGDEEKAPKSLRDWIRAIRRVEAAESPGCESLDEVAKRIERMSPRAEPQILKAIAADASALRDDGRYYFLHDSLHRTPMVIPFDAGRFAVFLRAIACPTLVVWGEHTPFRPKDTAERVAQIKNAQEIVIPGAGHNLHHEAPGETSSAIADFLAAQMQGGDR